MTILETQRVMKMQVNPEFLEENEDEGFKEESIEEDGDELDGFFD